MSRTLDVERDGCDGLVTFKVSHRDEARQLFIVEAPVGLEVTWGRGLVVVKMERTVPLARSLHQE